MKKFLSIILVLIILSELSSIGFILYKKFLPKTESSKTQGNFVP